MNILKLLNVFLMVSLLFSCNSDDSDFGILEIYQFQQNSELSINTHEGDESDADPQKFVNIEEGAFTIFKYSYVDKGEEGWADSGFSQFIYFQVDANLESFNYENEEFSNANVIVSRSCFCDYRYANPFNVESGKISGTKLENGSWKISLDFIIPDTSKDSIIEAIFEERKITY